MDLPHRIFIFPPVRDLHRDRNQRLREVISPGGPPSRFSVARQYSLAHHAFEGAEAAARAGDTELFHWYGTHPDAGVEGPSATAPGTSLPEPSCTQPSARGGPVAVVAPGVNRLVRSPASETPYYVLGPRTPQASPELLSLAAEAADCAGATGFGDLIAEHAVVLCLLRHKALGETLDSWSITRLPGTLFCDYTDEPAVLARDLVHEAGHSWLNDALTAVHAKISDEVSFYSPWKGTLRPAFGFLHACWSFPLMMLHTAAVLGSGECSGNLRRFLGTYIDEQRRLLAPTEADHAAALDLVPDPELRRRLRAVHQEALAL
ncbi:aKG-HExxH-type peptide beta-hydroxylase [Streptomyces chrestomyceticus]|uniref:aKG-HExxH-type peptide beta-hydroxylase n=1 Tax=Streptomyces chrestomyceticus TaxID=68185 RepID=UPI003797BA22